MTGSLVMVWLRGGLIRCGRAVLLCGGLRRRGLSCRGHGGRGVGNGGDKGERHILFACGGVQVDVSYGKLYIGLRAFL